MARIKEIPKLNVVRFQYNGDQNRFEKFLSNMAADYLNSDTLPEYPPINFIDLVEFSDAEAIPLDI